MVDSPRLCEGVLRGKVLTCSVCMFASAWCGMSAAGHAGEAETPGGQVVHEAQGRQPDAGERHVSGLWPHLWFVKQAFLGPFFFKNKPILILACFQKHPISILRYIFYIFF